MLRSIFGLTFERGDQIKVDPTLRVVSTQDRPIDGLFAIGDCASCHPEGSDHPIPATAQAAHQQAAHLARSLLREPTGTDGAPFRFRYLGTLVSFGADVVGDLPVPSRSIWTAHGTVRVCGAERIRRALPKPSRNLHRLDEDGASYALQQNASSGETQDQVALVVIRFVPDQGGRRDAPYHRMGRTGARGVASR